VSYLALEMGGLIRVFLVCLLVGGKRVLMKLLLGTFMEMRGLWAMGLILWGWGFRGEFVVCVMRRKVWVFS